MKQDNLELPRELESIIRINFNDCDPFGHLNNSRYIDYFFNARTDQLRKHLSFDVYEVGRETGKNWVVSQSKIAYYFPALFNQEVIVTSRMLAYSTFRVTAEYIMSDLNRKKLHAILWTDFTFVDLTTGKPAKHDPEMLKLFHKIVYNASDIDLENFSSRIKNIQRFFRKN